MSPKGSRHEAIKAAIVLHWGSVCPTGYAFVPETGLRLNESTYVEPDFVVFQRTVRLADLRGPDVLLGVEVADSSLSYDLERKPAIYAAFGVLELWVIDAAHRVIHRHVDYVLAAMPGSAAEALVPLYAPAAFAFTLDALEAI